MSDDRTIPVSEMLHHLADTANALQEKGDGFKAVVLLLVDKNDGWAGAVGGPGAVNLEKLLLIARDSLVRGDNSFTLFLRREENEHPLVNGSTLPANE